MLLAVGMCGVDLDHSMAPSQCWGQGGEGGTQPGPTPLTAWGGGWLGSTCGFRTVWVPHAWHNLFHSGLGVINGPIVRGSEGGGRDFLFMFNFPCLKGRSLEVSLRSAGRCLPALLRGISVSPSLTAPFPR